MRNRLHQAILIASVILGSWLGMQAVHESGHVLGAWLTGGRVVRVVLNPLEISRTDLDENVNPHPLAVVWAGPIFGVLAPLALWGGACRLGWPASFVVRFFAGFCLVANGLYIGIGSFRQVGDCGELLIYGSRPWHLWLFGLLTAPAGVWLWHGEGPHFGLGPAPQEISPRVAYGSLLACLALVALGFGIGG